MSKLDTAQRDIEYLLTDLDNYIYSNISAISCSKVKALMLLYGEQKKYYGNSYIKYIPLKDAFYLCIYKNGIFCREELYKYSVIEGRIIYIPVRRSYKEGVVNL